MKATVERAAFRRDRQSKAEIRDPARPPDDRADRPSGRRGVVRPRQRPRPPSP